MTVNCDVMTNVLTVLWVAIGALVAGPVCYVLGKRKQQPVQRVKRTEYVYRGPGGGR